MFCSVLKHKPLPPLVLHSGTNSPLAKTLKLQSIPIAAARLKGSIAEFAHISVSIHLIDSVLNSIYSSKTCYHRDIGHWTWISSARRTQLTDGRRPESLTLIPWRGGKNLAWDATATNTLTASYLPGLRPRGRHPAKPKSTANYLRSTSSPLATETLGPISCEGLSFSWNLDKSYDSKPPWDVAAHWLNL